jgi:uncharacterized BrkB/YihY/UPF0761 family membrane protein
VFNLIDDTARKVLDQRQAFWVTAGFLVALWQISGAVRAVMGALDNVYEAPHRPARSRYPLSIGLAIAVGMLLVLAFTSRRSPTTTRSSATSPQSSC